MATISVIIELAKCVPLCWRVATTERRTIKSFIIYMEPTLMIKNLFQLLESLLRAIMYLLILIIGLAATGLGSFLVVALAFRIGEFFWELILKEAWL